MRSVGKPCSILFYFIVHNCYVVGMPASLTGSSDIANIGNLGDELLRGLCVPRCDFSCRVDMDFLDSSVELEIA